MAIPGGPATTLLNDIGTICILLYDISPAGLLRQSEFVCSYTAVPDPSLALTTLVFPGEQCGYSVAGYDSSFFIYPRPTHSPHPHPLTLPDSQPTTDHGLGQRTRATRLGTVTATRLTTTSTGLTHSQWAHLNRKLNAPILLLIAGIELNPGPARSKKLRLAHANINSLSAKGRLFELEQFVMTNEIDILALTETKLDDSVHPSLYKLQKYHSPLLRHRNRHGGGTAIYAHASLSIRRLHDLELDDEEWVWAMIKSGTKTIIFCSVYLPPNPTSDRVSIDVDNVINVSVVNANGQVVLETKVNTFDVSSFKSGGYVLRVQTEEGVFVQQLVKE